MSDRHNKAERQAIERHRLELCALRQCDVSFDDAESDWRETVGPDWRQRRQEIMMSLQREEIMRHKWIESEKADCDVGKEVYAQWINQHAAEWREWYQQHEVDILRDHQLL